ncbi:type II toxin-antitoxin system RelE/ParE family toxin [Mesorhizobium sp. CN2-181]|uniref:type II toxin-antitoxin system RelE/ParE family toxin n=1 Tax=Mesorhizobium yinganensis TaxID=3157707 RepID=UPI0032B836CA
MQLIRSSQYRDDFENIFEHIAQQSPQAAKNIGLEIERQVRRPEEFPMLGRAGRLAGTRELVIATTPYIVVYYTNGVVVLLRVLHGAQKWPPSRPDSLR